MHRRRTRWAVAAAFAVWTATPGSGAAQDRETVIEWNQILQTALTVPGALPPSIFFTRPYAMTHVAIFDALNSIDYVYTEYATRAEVPAQASREAAVAQAARDVLVAQFPNQRATFDAALAATLNRLPPEAAAAGAEVGAAAARACVGLRANDGWSAVPPQYLNPDLPGYWQPVPPANLPAGLTHYSDVTGFTIGSGRSWLVEPPPALTSERYARDLNEVKAIGSATSTTRTEEQTQMARLWANVGTPTTAPGVWNNVVRDIARARNLNGLETARIYALLNMGVHDALLVSITSKYVYGFWRPTTAIRGADRDGNAATERDGEWLALLVTPPYPSYPGNMACIGGVSSRILARLFGRDDIAFSVTWATPTGGVTRPYNGFRQLADEEARSRVYGGIHFEFDSLSSMGTCTALADYVVDNQLRVRFE